jgi:Rad52/22 family double-strand break repair protein
MTQEQIQKLNAPLPEWAVKPHPTRKNMSAIHPMAVIDRLNEVFGVGAWNWETSPIECTKEIQKTQKGDRAVYISAVHGKLSVPTLGLRIEQFGGSTNDDKGDALKGGSTDALTKCASYLGIGASIYKGQGNTEPVEACAKLGQCATLEELKKAFIALPKSLQSDVEVVAMKDELKNKLS